MSQDNPKRLILSYQKVDVTYIFHILSKYMSFNYGIVQRIRFSHCEPIKKNGEIFFPNKHLVIYGKKVTRT